MAHCCQSLAYTRAVGGMVTLGGILHKCHPDSTAPPGAEETHPPVEESCCPLYLASPCLLSQEVRSSQTRLELVKVFNEKCQLVRTQIFPRSVSWTNLPGFLPARLAGCWDFEAETELCPGLVLALPCSYASRSKECRVPCGYTRGQ